MHYKESGVDGEIDKFRIARNSGSVSGGSAMRVRTSISDQ